MCPFLLSLAHFSIFNISIRQAKRYHSLEVKSLIKFDVIEWALYIMHGVSVPQTHLCRWKKKLGGGKKVLLLKELIYRPRFTEMCPVGFTIDLLLWCSLKWHTELSSFSFMFKTNCSKLMPNSFVLHLHNIFHLENVKNKKNAS